MKFENTIIGLIYLSIAGVLYYLGVVDLAINTFVYRAYSPNDKMVAILITTWLSALFAFLTITGYANLNKRTIEVWKHET